MNVSALILAGGEGRRMSGRDKGLIEWQGRAFVDHVIGRIRPQVGHIAISANRNLEEYAARSAHVFADARQWQGLGPLAALCTSASDIQLAKADWLLVVPCDTLYLPENLVQVFQAAAQRSPLCSAFYAQTDNQQHYSVMFFRPQLLPSSIAYLNAGMRTIRGWLQQQRARSVQFAADACFANYNSPQDMDTPPC
ncbi:molybdenum cofactor guanylyltransferase [Uruburuella testudinis]|uniref:Molybdenum cofactor guanylyltransferase n=1 Tax=Uruburuella testudinis TaxID=1282863 RepID=A0ABY4DP32_9NEIS|nr:molybdenum cofactor guanylyltransferase MobA [Uruburuella testudinis]UOO80821.1 molybdenum cofactor guanylyltransferase [Uruburuella testudinis]